MKCITLSSGKQVCFDSTPKAQTGRYNIPLSKEEQLMQQARAQGDIPVAPGIVKAKEKLREQEAVEKKLAKQGKPLDPATAKYLQKAVIDYNKEHGLSLLQDDVLAEQIRRNQQSLSNPDDRSIEADIVQDLHENGALGLLDAPIKGATALVTGRYQTPSQAIGRWANQNNHQMLRNAMIDDQFNPTGLGMVTDFGGETGLGLAAGKVLSKASTLTPRLVKNSDDVDINFGFYNLDKNPNIKWTKLTKEEVAALEKNNPNLFTLEKISDEYSPEKIKQIKDAQQKQVNLAREFTEKWGYQNIDELNRLDARATLLNNQLKNTTFTDPNLARKVLNEYRDTRQQIRDGNFIDPTFKEKITKLFEEGNIKNPNDPMFYDPMYGPELRDRTRLVYVNPNDPSLSNLSTTDYDYIMNNFADIGGIRTPDATITIGSKPTSAHYRKDTLTPNNQTKSEYILKQKTKYTPIDETGFIVAHEYGHDLQDPFNWVYYFQENNPKYNYYVGHDRNPVATRFKNAMIEPTVPGPDGNHTRETWLSGIGELHSDLMGERFKEVKNLMDYEGMSMDDAIKLLKTDPDPFLTRLINSNNFVNQHFKPTTSNEEKLNLLRMLPALGVGALGVGAAAKSVGAKEPVQKVGGKNINTTGYLDNSDTKHNPYNIIPSNNITMDGVSIPLMLMPDGDQARVVMPNSGEYNFPNSQYVTEIPLAQKGRVNYPQPTSQDSLNVYNSQIALNKFYDNEVKEGRLTSDYPFPFYYSNKKDPIKMKKDNLKFYQILVNSRQNNNSEFDGTYNQIFNLTPEDLSKLEYEGLIKNDSTNPYQVYYRDLVTGMQNLAAPYALYDSRIAPQYEISYTPTSFKNTYPGGIVRFFAYDPIAPKPFDMRTPEERIEWEKKYGKSKPQPKLQPKSKPKEKPIERTTLEPVESKSVPMLESNFEPTPITPMSVDRPMMQPSNEEYNKQYSITIPTVKINKRQVAPRVSRVNPKPNYKRSIDVDTRQLPIMDEYTLNKLRMKLGMNPKGFQTGGQAVKKGPGPFLIPESRPQFKSMPVPNRQDPRFMAYQDSVIQNNKSIQALQDFNKAYNAKQPYVATPENLTDDYKNSGVKKQAKYTNPKNTKNYLQPSKKIDDLNEEQRANLIQAFDTQQEGTPTNLPTALYYGDMFNNSTYLNEDMWFDYHTNPVQPYHVEPMELIQSKTPGPLSTSFERPAPSVPQVVPYTPTGKGFSPKTEGLTVPVPTIEVSREVAPPRSNQLFRKNVVNPKQRVKTNVKVDIDQREIMDRSKLDSLRESVGLEPKGYQKGGKTDDATFKKFVATLPPNLRNTGSDYNLRGYWESLGKPSTFDYSQPKESDGVYHAYSRNSETGEILKKPNHPTFGQALEEDRKLGYYPYQSSTGVMHTFKPNEVPQGFNVPIYPTLNNIKKQTGGKNTKTIKLSSGKIITFK